MTGTAIAIITFFASAIVLVICGGWLIPRFLVWLVERNPPSDPGDGFPGPPNQVP